MRIKAKGIPLLLCGSILSCTLAGCSIQNENQSMYGMLSSIMGSNISHSNDQEIAVAIEDMLYEKHGESFTVTAVGNRFNNTTTTAYVHPDSNPNIQFTVRLHDDGYIEYDDYQIKCIEQQMVNVAVRALAEQGVTFENVTASICMVGGNQENEPAEGTTLRELVNNISIEYGNITFMVRADDALKGEKIVTAFSQIAEAMGNTCVGISMCVVQADDYDLLLPQQPIFPGLYNQYDIETANDDIHYEPKTFIFQMQGDKLMRNGEDEMHPEAIQEWIAENTVSWVDSANYIQEQRE